MRAKDFLKEYSDIPTPTPEQVATKHGVLLDKVIHELDKGIAIEMEHTQDKNIAAEIALDHLGEDIEYYTKILWMERGFQ